MNVSKCEMEWCRECLKNASGDSCSNKLITGIKMMKPPDVDNASDEKLWLKQQACKREISTGCRWQTGLHLKTATQDVQQLILLYIN